MSPKATPSAPSISDSRAGVCRVDDADAVVDGTRSVCAANARWRTGRPRASAAQARGAGQNDRKVTRSILEVLDEFTSVNLPWEQICSIIPAMRGRQVSIASGGALKQYPQSAGNMSPRTKVELLVAIVKYRTVIKRIRQGVCTRYVASLQPGQQIIVTMQKGGLHPKEADMLKPVVMVGPGTGVAPMRSLIFERSKWREDHGVPTVDAMQDVLFFGCRNEQSDYFFKEEWAMLGAQEALKTFAAFSRDQVCVAELLL